MFKFIIGVLVGYCIGCGACSAACSKAAEDDSSAPKHYSVPRSEGLGGQHNPTPGTDI